MDLAFNGLFNIAGITLAEVILLAVAVIIIIVTSLVKKSKK